MSPETRDIFWTRHARQREDIERTARQMAEQHQEPVVGLDGSPMDGDTWFAWCVAAERQLTALAISRQRYELVQRIHEAAGAGHPTCTCGWSAQTGQRQPSYKCEIHSAGTTFDNDRPSV